MLTTATKTRASGGARLAVRLRHLLRTCDGVAATDFALVAPILVTLLIASIEIGRYTMINMKLGGIAGKAGDLVSQAEEAITDDINQVFAATALGMKPYEIGSDGVVFISSVAKVGGGASPVKVMWQLSGGGTLTAESPLGKQNNIANMPNGLTVLENQSYIVAEVIYDYSPLFLNGVISPRRLYYAATYRPRLGSLVTLDP